MRLIDADNLLKNIKKQMGISPNYRITAGWCVVREPTVDAVPVIRCKDCKFFDRLTSELTFCIRGSTEEEPNAMVMTEIDYCSKGERKENDNG